MSEPFFFQSGHERLYGCFHPAAGRAQGDGAAVICYPAGHEYLMAHRACRLLAARLAERGTAVLRFDYSGTGDATGGEECIDLARWGSDIEAAIDVLCDRSGRRRVSLVGVRLGASLALRVAGADERVERIVLWDPVLDGRLHLDEITELHRDHFPPEAGAASGPPTEVLGFALPAALRTGLAGLDLLAATGSHQPGEVLLVDTQGSVAAQELASRLEVAGARVAREALAVPGYWSPSGDNVLVPNQVIKGIVSWMTAHAA